MGILKKKITPAKSKIIKDLVDDCVSLERSLTRLYVLAKTLQNEPLCNWINNELHGYKDSLPEYRKTQSVFFKYDGFNGRYQVKNVTLPSGFLGDKALELFSEISISEGIGFVEKMANDSQEKTYDRTELAGIVLNNSQGHIRCTAIRQIIPNQFCLEICSCVKGKILDALLTLENEYGNLDEYGIDLSEKRSNQVFDTNAKVNHLVLNLQEPIRPAEKWYSKVAWNVVIPIVTGIIGMLIGTYLLSQLGF